LPERSPLFIGLAHKSGITEKHHEAKIHVALLMTVKERRAWIGRNEVDLRCAIGGHYDDVLAQA
jgi:hypothetical protein